MPVGSGDPMMVRRSDIGGGVKSSRGVVGGRRGGGGAVWGKVKERLLTKSLRGERGCADDALPILADSEGESTVVWELSGSPVT